MDGKAGSGALPKDLAGKKAKGAPAPFGGDGLNFAGLNLGHVDGLEAFRAFVHLKLHLVIFLEGTET